MDILFCDRCNSSIPEPAVAEGRGLLTPTLRLCVSCLETLASGPDRESLRCERCGGGIPLSDPGGARIAGGHLLCGVACSGSLARSLPFRIVLGIRDLGLGVDPRGRAARLFLVLLASSIALALSTVELVRREIAAKDGTGPLARLLGRGERNPVLLVPPGQEERDRVLSATLDRIKALEGAIEDLALDHEARGRSPDDFVAMENDLMLRLLELRALVERRLAEVRNDLERRHVDEETLRNELSRLERRLDDLQAIAEEPGNASKPGEESGSEEPDEVGRWLSILDADEAGLRFSAVVELARIRDPRCLDRFSVLLLGDPDQFVRQQVALGIAVFRERSTIPVLIKALFDPEPGVGLAAAESLRELTGKTFGFVSKATPSDRRAAAQKWEDWWDREKRDQ